MAKNNYDLGSIESSASGMDAFFEAEPTIVSPVGTAKQASKPMRVKVGSLQQLTGFKRLSGETLVNKATQDLWALKKEGEDYYIERLFQEDGQPLKG